MNHLDECRKWERAGMMKIWPFCSLEIQDATIKCRHCGATLTDGPQTLGGRGGPAGPAGGCRCAGRERPRAPGTGAGGEFGPGADLCGDFPDAALSLSGCQAGAVEARKGLGAGTPRLVGDLVKPVEGIVISASL